MKDQITAITTITKTLAISTTTIVIKSIETFAIDVSYGSVCAFPFWQKTYV
jgi:hypothetical protein